MANPNFFMGAKPKLSQKGLTRLPALVRGTSARTLKEMPTSTFAPVDHSHLFQAANPSSLTANSVLNWTIETLTGKSGELSFVVVVAVIVLFVLG